MKKTKLALLHSVIALILCCSMLIGTTFAWFTDSVSSGVNQIVAGNLDVELEYYNGTRWVTVTDSTNVFKENTLWEPGHTEVVYLRIRNAGTLALKYQLGILVASQTLGINVYGDPFKLSDYIHMGVVENAQPTYTSRDAAISAAQSGANGTLSAGYAKSGSMTPAQEQYLAVVVYMPEEVDNVANYMTGTTPPEINLGISLVATQMTAESDSFGDDYDQDAQFPVLKPGSVTVDITGKVSNGQLDENVTMANTEGNLSAVVPAGTKVTGNSLTLSVSELSATGTNITLQENQILRSMDVHIEGVATDNTVPAVITVKEAMMTGLNIGNYALYHVEDGVESVMTADSSLDTHNDFAYDPATGDVTLAMATFSEVALVADTVKPWEGEFDYTWYDADAAELTIANADQLAAFGAIVGGMDGQTQDSFKDKTVKLISDINLGDKESENNPDIIFYPIGYWNNEGTYERKPLEERTTAVESGFYTFEGTFDGNGHTISNFYQNTWEMKGDHNWYDPIKEQYYRDGMGLFGRVYGGTVKNLTVSNFSSDGEIATTGCIAAYAEGATFENIAIFDCNPRVYNIGNGGIVGCVGWYAKEADLKTTFKNITVDNSNKISALWGSYDVACGGIVGQYYPTSGQSSYEYPVNAGIDFVNCHVSAQMDVYNDVCANYQYYAYRYTGMLIGSVRENVTIDGHVYPNMDGITASGCTVHFGDWNDYYYCELVANTTASYTHDHQFSRLEQVDSVDVENMKVTSLKGVTTDIPTSGRVNYVVVNGVHATENATCYHFVDGKVHNHDDYNGDGVEDYETVNGESIRVENNRHIYLEFNNLFTGYGWGVTSKGVGDLAGVTILDRLEGSSVDKFDTKDNMTSVSNSVTIRLDHLFEENTEVTEEVNVLLAALTVSITNLDEDGTVALESFNRGSTWADSTITLSGTGKVAITIQDYYFCTPTTITVNVTERVAEEKFVKKFTNENFTYRIGNQNAVTLGSLFVAANGVTIGENVAVTIETVSGNASGTYTSNVTWTSGTIQFSGTGVVKVTITDNNYCIPTELLLEVVEATNATGATNATSNNVVLLNDCGFSSLTVSNGYALYGNGFTMTCGSDSAALDMGYAFVTLNNGTLDNVQIVCPNFDYAVLYKSNMTESGNRSETTDKTRYFNVKSGVMVSGNSQILNSRISGARAAVNVSGGNCVIDNSRIELGAVASLLVGAANSVTLRDVTLIQRPTESTYVADGAEKGTTLMGFSVLMICNSDGDAAPLTLEGTLIQNAWVDENDSQYVPSAGQSIISGVLSNEAYTHDLDGDGTRESLNLGFAYMPESSSSVVNATTITDYRTDKDTVPYDYAKVSILNGSTYVYSYEYGDNESIPAEYVNTSDYIPNKYSDIINVTYSDTTEGLTTGKSYGTSGWIFELNVDLDTVSGYKLDFAKLSMSVNGVAVTDYLVDGNAKPTSPVAVTAGGTTYTLTATANGTEYTATYKVTGTETSKESPSLVASNYEAALLVGEAGNTLNKDTWHGAVPVLNGIQIKYWSVAEKQYKTITLSDYTPTIAGKQNGTNAEWTYSPDNGDFTLTIKNETAVHSSNSVYAMPVVVNSKLYFVASSSNGLVNYGNSARTIKINYYFKDNNSGEELKFDYTWSIECDDGNTAYDYSDFCNGTSNTFAIKSSNGDGCVTPDTLVTLADGTQKEIQYVTYADQLLAWDFFKGEYTAVPAAIVFDHGYGNNTVVELKFSDGTTVKVVNLHQFFDADLNKFVSIDADSVADYVGHKFAKKNGDSYEMVTLMGYTVTEEYCEAWGIISAEHYNIFVEDMLSTDFMKEDFPLFNYFEVGEDMMFDEDKMQVDIEKYGLYTYEDFAEYLSYEQFMAFNVQYFKIAVGKGEYTFEGILALIETYLNN